jgi:hypothetical protein
MRENPHIQLQCIQRLHWDESNGLAPCSSKLKRTKHSHNASAYDTCNGHTRLATSRPWGREGAGEGARERIWKVYGHTCCNS